MEMTPGWCIWWVDSRFLPKALNQLDEAGTDMSLVKLVQVGPYADQETKWNILVVYKNERK